MMERRFIHIIIILLLFCATSSSEAQVINLNLEIQKLCASGDSAMNENNITYAEKLYTKACEYTDTLVLSITKKIKNPRYTFTKSNNEVLRIMLRGMFKNYYSSKHAAGNYPLELKKVFFAYEKLGSLYMLSGNTALAEKLFNKSLTQRQLVFNKRSVYRIYPYVLLGQLYLEEGKIDQSLGYLRQANKLVDRATTTGFNFDVLRQQLYALHFEASLKNRDVKEAWKYLQRYYFALNTIGPTNEQLATAFERKARYYLFMGNYPETKIYLEKAEKKLSHARSIFSEAEVKVYRTKAIYYWNLNQRDSAALVFEKLLNSYENNIQKNFPSMSEHEREQFYITLKNDFDLFNSFVVAGMKAGEANSRLFEILYNTQLFTKAMLLNELSKTRRAILSEGNKSLLAKIKDWEKNKTRISYLHYNNNTRKAETEIELLERQIDALEKEINEKTSLLRKSGEEARWQQVRGALKTGEAAVELVRAKPFKPESFKDTTRKKNDTIDYIFLVVKPGSIAPEGFLMNDGKNMEDRYLSFYRNCILHKIHDNLSYTHFWKPIGDRLNGVTTAYLSCDGVYNQINLNALQNQETASFVLDEINLEFVTNTKDLLIPSINRTDSTAWLLGRAVYSKDTINEVVIPYYADLPGTEKEVENIAQLLSSSHWKVKTFLLEEASEERLKAIKSVETIHIATHGFFNANERGVNAMINSGIVLSKDSTEDGILTAYEASGLSLDSAQLVVLSACETGLGEVKNGEGVYGLQRGLKVAGVKNILMSLWKVDDEATAKLMTNFYKAWLGGMEIHKAFRQSQMILRQSYPSPYYWGSFILLGD